MKRLLVLLLALLLVGCDSFPGSKSNKQVFWCDKLENEEIRIRLDGWIVPIQAKVLDITTDRDGCWYSIRITDDEHIQPRRLFVHERRVL